MSNYTFSTLNDKDLEELALDLLNAQLKLDLQSFKIGADEGVDLRHSTSKNDNSIVVQVKHYLKSGYSKLRSDLKNKELEKVKKLNHPSGNLTASASDIHITKKLVEAGKLLELPILDHIILTDYSFISMADEGLIK